ncbi:MAG TPA: hypothetical protein DEA22_03410 [Blastocatellia bacterium]|nr:hypothetical protein [Blastocatellia bacterium]
MATKYSPHDALRLIRRILNEGGYFRPTRHCRQRMRQRNVDDQDLSHLFDIGTIEKEPEWDDEHQTYKYRVEGHDLEGDELIAVTVITEQDFRLVVVTVF